jgi:hypothetical protein
MKIDFKQLAKLEKQYKMNDNHVTLNTLQSMVDQVMAYNPNDTGSFLSREGNITLAIETLKELGVLKDEPAAQKVIQLNS